MLHLLRKQNLIMIEKYEKESNFKKVTKHRIIGELLKDDECFKKLTIEEAGDILKSLNVNNWEAVYVELLKK